ncbi:MAG: 4-alpha-glucanotransferase [Rhodothermia bacterium]|nr:4-alpha-glucanotransferase [Rhodothermia bacterium]
MAHHRASGVLLHITSLPGRYGIGDLGHEAYAFAEKLAAAKQKIWQVLPLVPVGHGYSPYSSPSTFAGNPLLISPDLLLEEGFLDLSDLDSLPDFSNHHVEFERVIRFKTSLLEIAFQRFQSARHSEAQAFERFCDQEKTWLDDYALFMAIRESQNNQCWTDWPGPVRDRTESAIEGVRSSLGDRISVHKFWQFLFARQWDRFRRFCNSRSISVVGDIPIYVAHDSADVWSEPHLFQLDDVGQPTVVAGVPPDYFSETGQRWGNPIYRWETMRDNEYDWWTRRMASILKQVDVVRLDHFRGFEAYWEVPASEPTAVKGRWVEGPGAGLFETLKSRLVELPVIAEDLGLITPGVVELMDRFGFPGMAVMQFAFDGDADDKFLPHNYRRNLVAYTGTHDNDTLHGWYSSNRSTQDAAQVNRAREYCRSYLGVTDHNSSDIHVKFIRALQMSVADTVVIPLQDVLGLGTEARMNVPGEGLGNWTWRFAMDDVTDEVVKQMAEFASLYGRAPA